MEFVGIIVEFDKFQFVSIFFKSKLLLTITKVEASITAFISGLQGFGSKIDEYKK